MNPSLKIVQIDRTAATDIPASLRKLAEEIESGNFGDAHNVAWVIDCGDSRLELGVLGKTSEPAPIAYMLFGLAKRRLESSALGEE